MLAYGLEAVIDMGVGRAKCVPAERKEKGIKATANVIVVSLAQVVMVAVMNMIVKASE
jgi:hypothetical protein